MTKFLDSLPLQARQSPGQSLLVFLILFILGLFVAQFIGLIFSLPFIGLDLEALQLFFDDPSSHPRGRTILLINQFVSSLLTFIVFPLLYLRMIEKQPARNLSPQWNTPLVSVGLLVVMLFAFLVVDARVIVWNQNMTFPESLSGLESVLRNMEDTAAKTMGVITQMDNTGQLLILLVVVAVLPGIGEEIVFRGVIQNLLHRWTRNPHVAIWVSAILFSAIHFQFYGFFPRLFLGALFGYIYVWSGRLSLAMLAHFLNNAFSLTMVYLQQKGYFEDAGDTPELMPWGLTIAAAGLMAAVMFAFHRHHQKAEQLI